LSGSNFLKEFPEITEVSQAFTGSSPYEPWQISQNPVGQFHNIGANNWIIAVGVELTSSKCGK
jgi:hypothetical protein